MEELPKSKALSINSPVANFVPGNNMRLIVPVLVIARRKGVPGRSPSWDLSQWEQP